MDHGEKHKLKGHSPLPIRITERTEENIPEKNFESRKESTFATFPTIPIVIEDPPLKSAPNKLSQDKGDIQNLQNLDPKSIYSFKVTLPANETLTNINTSNIYNQTENNISPNKPILLIQESPVEKREDREESKMQQTIEPIERSEIESLGVIRNLTDGTATPQGDNLDPKNLRFSQRNLLEGKVRRPLGNKRYPMKPGYTNLSEDESISAGGSFLASGSPGTFQEISEDKGYLPLSSMKTPGSGRYLVVPNGPNSRVFQFPEPNNTSPLAHGQSEDSMHYEHKEWEVKHGKIDEEDEKDDLESEQEKERNRISEKEMNGKNIEEEKTEFYEERNAENNCIPEMRLWGSNGDNENNDNPLYTSQKVIHLKEIVSENGSGMKVSKMMKSQTFTGVMNTSEVKQEYNRQISDFGPNMRYNLKENEGIKEDVPRVFMMGEESNMASSQKKQIPNEAEKAIKV